LERRSDHVEDALSVDSQRRPRGRSTTLAHNPSKLKARNQRSRASSRSLILGFLQASAALPIPPLLLRIPPFVEPVHKQTGGTRFACPDEVGVVSAMHILLFARLLTELCLIVSLVILSNLIKSSQGHILQRMLFLELSVPTVKWRNWGTRRVANIRRWYVSKPSHRSIRSPTRRPLGALC
jgi:hypothetical protein